VQKNLILLGATLVFCLVLAELILRVVGLGRPLIHEYDAELLWRMPAHQVAYAPSFRVTYRTNGQGWREDTEVALEPEAGEFRILALGDSVLFGHGVPFEETLAERLERSLRPPPDFDRIEVVNTAVSGYCLYQYATFLADRGYAYQPDLLLLAFVKNDVVTEADIAVLRERAREGRQENVGDRSSRLRRSSAILHAAHGLFTRLRAFWVPEPRALAFEGVKTEHQDWRYTIELLTRIAESASERRIPLLIVVFPSRQEVDQGDVVVGIEPIEDLKQRFGFHVVDLHPSFVRRASEPLFLDPIHPTSLGHEIAAEVVRAQLRESGLLEGKPR
jgi:lysophospholipase L1-like esterase